MLRLKWGIVIIEIAMWCGVKHDGDILNNFLSSQDVTST